MLHRLIGHHRRRARGRADARRAALCRSRRARRSSARRCARPSRPTLARPGRGACAGRPSPPRSKESRSSWPTTRPRRRSRSPSPCAKSWRPRARPRPSSRPIRRSRAGWRRSWRAGASRSRIRPAGRWARPRRARWRGSSSRRRSSFAPLSAQALLAHPAARLGRARERARRRRPRARARRLPRRAAPLARRSRQGLRRRARGGRRTDTRIRPIRGDRRRRRAARRRTACARSRGDARALAQALGAPTLRELPSARIARRSPRSWPRPKARRLRRMGSRRLTNSWRNGARRPAKAFPARSPNMRRCSTTRSLACRAPAAAGGHPRLKILGLLEARLLSFDRVLLAGLDETVWPPAVETDAFLNRPMRAALGLSAPERRIGQTAHDFVAALGAREAILSRAKKRDGEPTVASRFLQRIGAAGGAEALEAAKRRGRRLSPLRAGAGPAGQGSADRAAGADAAGRAAAALRSASPGSRPCGATPIRSTPSASSGSRRSSRSGASSDAREAGEAWHGALQDFAELYPSGPLPPDARATLVRLARATLCGAARGPVFRGPGLAEHRERRSTSSSTSRRRSRRDRAHPCRAPRRDRLPARGRRAVQADARGRTASTCLRSGERGSSTTRAARRQASKRGQGRPCAAADPRSRDPRARRLRRARTRMKPAPRALSEARRRRRRQGA